MSEIKGIYAASLSILDNNLALNVDKTIQHAENLIDMGCHGVAVFGSTGQSQLISISEKIQLLNKLAKSKYKDNYIIGTGLNSLSEIVNLMKVSKLLNKFFIVFSTKPINVFFITCRNPNIDRVMEKNFFTYTV